MFHDNINHNRTLITWASKQDQGLEVTKVQQPDPLILYIKDISWFTFKRSPIIKNWNSKAAQWGILQGNQVTRDRTRQIIENPQWKLLKWTNQHINRYQYSLEFETFRQNSKVQNELGNPSVYFNWMKKWVWAITTDPQIYFIWIVLAQYM